MDSMELNYFISKSGMAPELVRAVVRQSGGWESFKEMASDVARHGADGGFHGWIYYGETCEFFKRHRKHILEYAEEMARELGEEVLEMISHFGVFRNDSITQSALARALYQGKGDDVETVQNVMAWFALEEVARRFDDLA